MKITIFGSCRQDSLYSNEKYEITKIQNDISFPHYTKEILELIKFIKYNTMKPEETVNTFRSPILTKIPIYSENYKDELLNTDVFIIEIASKISYLYNNRYVHHILYDDSKNFTNEDIKQNIIKRIEDDKEIENDILEIVKELNTKKIIIIGHIVTYEHGERYKLLKLLEEICKKYNILFINPVKELTKREYDIYELTVKERVISHYNEKGHKIISSIYDEYINSII
jgi:hypothetical protein